MLSLYRKLLDVSITYKTFLPSSSFIWPISLFKKASLPLYYWSVVSVCYKICNSTVPSILLYTSAKLSVCTQLKKNFYQWLERGRKVSSKTDSLSNTSRLYRTTKLTTFPWSTFLSYVFSSMKAENSASNPPGIIIHLVIKTAHFSIKPFLSLFSFYYFSVRF